VAFNRILCGVDFSRDALEAFRVAVEMARLYSGAIHIFHVIEALPAVSGEVAIEIVEKANAAMQGLVASAESSLKGLPSTSEVTTGEASAEIVNRAREWKADLIVLGAKGITLPEELFVGGTAQGVVKESPCSILVVRADDKQDRRPV
jgi:nucleotide-binding universal stress UspA family protein